MKKAYTIFKFTIIALCVTTIFSALVFSLLIEPLIPLPGNVKLDKSLLGTPTKNLRLFDINNEEIDLSHYSVSKNYVMSDVIPLHVKNAFICAEDKRFYNHYGIDAIRLIGALKNNILAGSFKEGASTISQQLMKNTHLNSEKNMKRKMQEIRLAIDLERNFSKTEILEKYLNVLYFGNNIYGISAAAKQFFGKQVSELTLSESALIAGIIKSPANYSPLHNFANAIARKNLILKLMLEQNKITQSEYETAKTEIPTIKRGHYASSQYLNGIIDEATKILGITKDELYSSNYTVHSNFDFNLQKKLTSAIENFDINNTKLAAILIDTKTGKVLSYESNTTDNIIDVKRLPGSTIKPFVSFIPALSKKLVYPISPILDEPTSFGEYQPSNFKEKYYGWTTVENSLIQSLNIPAIKLMENAGIEYSKDIANRFGLTFDQKDSSYAIALGGLTNGFTLKQLANAYQALANMGEFKEANFISGIKNGSNKVFCLPVQREATDRATAYLINDMLSKCAKEGTAKRLKNINNVCAKTGTVGTKAGNTDGYCIAYNSNYTLLVWEGSEKPNDAILGGNVPAKIAADFFGNVPPAPPYAIPNTVKKLDIDIRQLNENRRIMLANENVAQRYRKKATFSIDNIPNEYSGYVDDDYYEYFIGYDFFNFKKIYEVFD